MVRAPVNAFLEVLFISTCTTLFLSVLLFPKQQILDPSKLKKFEDNNSKFYENGRKFSNKVEDTGGKGEQFLLFPQCFQ